MENAKRLLVNLPLFSHGNENGAPLQRDGASAHFSRSNFEARNSHHGRLITNSPLDHSHHFRELDLFGDGDHLLDNFDKELLSEQPQERQWQAENGLARISLPPKSLAITYGSDPSRTLKGDLLDASSRSHPSSSSPTGLRSSPTVSALQNRIPQVKRQGNSRIQPKSSMQPPSKALPIGLGHPIPSIQGTHFVRTTDLPDRFRSIFPYLMFNAVQSRCFSIAFGSGDNLVVSAPTGSGKTALMELAVCQLVAASRNSDFKIIYQAPTKSLCAERYRDWQTKFGALDIQCAELTGDTGYNQLHSVQSASIIVTTPEKWDSVTRKWKDNARLMEMVKLFLIDEVHILKESRGATLEAVVSRMKSVGSKVRFVALSATIPNSHDIATWLGKNAESQHLPAHQEIFGEEFRPVQLQKIVKGYSFGSGNDYAFEQRLNDEIPRIIAEYSQKKPIMVFCFTRNSALRLSKMLSDLWLTTNDPSRLWRGPTDPIRVMDAELQSKFVVKYPMLMLIQAGTSSSGVAFHHGGLDPADRRAVEQGFLSGNIKIICSTSTLAVGVNLPCYLVIIKGTVGWSDHGAQEYPDLEMMQMLGRAGRPQFERTACAVILTQDHKVRRYEKMVSGEEILESCLHMNLIDHLNAEIGLGTVHDIPSAKRWLAGTFLFVRLPKNPARYQLEEDGHSNNEEELLERICEKEINLLRETDLVSKQGPLKVTEYGDAMARYYVKFKTMILIMALPSKAKQSEILSALAQATEFRDIRVRGGDKALYKHFNSDPGIKFPIKVDLALPAHRASLLIQTELGGVAYPNGNAFKKNRSQYQIDKSMVFSHINRLIRCVIDCQLHREDSVSTRHALELGRSIAAKVWDNSPLQLKQIEGIGNVSLRKFAGAGINSIEMLANTEANRIDTILGHNPPFGNNMLCKVAKFPNPRVSVKPMGKEAEAGKCVRIRFKAEIGFLNDALPLFFDHKPVYVCFLAETSDGKVIEFRRFGAKKLANGQEILLSVELTKPTASINCYVMCDEIAGTSRHAELRLEEFPVSWFPPIDRRKAVGEDTIARGQQSGAPIRATARSAHDLDNFSDEELHDSDFLAAASEKKDGVVEDIDELMGDIEMHTKPKKNTRKRTASHISTNDHEDEDASVITWREPQQLENGRWTCQHDCTDVGRNCKHKCCSEGVEKRRKRPKKLTSVQDDDSRSIKTEVLKKPAKKPESPFEASQHGFEERKRKQAKPEALHMKALEKLHKATKTRSGTHNGFSLEEVEPARKFSKKKTPSNKSPDGLAGDYEDDFWSTNFNQGELSEEDELSGHHGKRVMQRREPLTKENEDSFGSADDGFDADWPSTEGTTRRDRRTSLMEKAIPESGHAVGDPPLDVAQPIDSSCTREIAEALPLCILDSDIDLGRFRAPLSHVRLEDVKKRPKEATYGDPGKTDEKLSADKGSSITREGRRPYKMLPRIRKKENKSNLDDYGLREDFFVDIEENDDITPPPKKQKSDIGEKTLDTWQPLEELTDTHVHMPPSSTTKAVQKAVIARDVGDAEQERENILKEEEQKRKWEGIDPEFYEMLKDCVEIV